MREDRLRDMLRRFRKGKLSEDGLLEALKLLPFEDIQFAKVDHHRSLRCGFPEVIFCERKSPEEVAGIVEAISSAGNSVLATRASVETYKTVRKRFAAAEYNERARTITVLSSAPDRLPGRIVIVAAGTGDIPVAEEARVTAEVMGASVETIYDVGVAGLHRLLRYHSELLKATAIVVVAGMEGALAGVVGGLVRAPVIAVPTSVGYGASFHGLAPLLTMLNSCAAGVSVVNIDNGFGGGYVAALICAVKAKEKRDE
jgi:NCAIR mutase (PurE)-related protein